MAKVVTDSWVEIRIVRPWKMVLALGSDSIPMNITLPGIGVLSRNAYQPSSDERDRWALKSFAAGTDPGVVVLQEEFWDVERNLIVLAHLWQYTASTKPAILFSS
jgi:hypothetical protein